MRWFLEEATPWNSTSCPPVAAWAITPTRSWGDSGFGKRSKKMDVLAEPLTTSPAVEPPAWKALEPHYKKVRKLHLRKLFADDATGGERLTAEAAGIYLDYSKYRKSTRLNSSHLG